MDDVNTSPVSLNSQAFIHFSVITSSLVSIGQVIIGICLLLRTYALYGRTRLMLTVLCTTAAAEMVYVVWQTATEKPHSTPSTSNGFERCLLPFGSQGSTQLRPLWIDQLCFDVLIFALTLYKALLMFRDGTSNVLSIMLRDGTIYFGVMIIMAILGIVDFTFFPVGAFDLNNDIEGDI
ncbi:hypothetical protein GALMADRAFT_137455 [Galerina marginata CBS 339.88]|uniref:Uncharacterized protein n=1 Tax=Galerina marginata (strain CBS 339.88) TaxID=685588 RepID=A0A067T940_GALM3|nr:hypothetical protein GALMADRAFT_137455 [Galerina marginata CBS 339.88]